MDDVVKTVLVICIGFIFILTGIYCIVQMMGG